LQYHKPLCKYFYIGLYPMTLPAAAWSKTVFQAAGAHGINDDGIVAEW